MEENFFGKFYCEFCDKEISVYVFGDRHDIEWLKTHQKEDTISHAKSDHWYDNHYNCAVCGKWIVGKERIRIARNSFKNKIHEKYNSDSVEMGLLRVHKKCLEK